MRLYIILEFFWGLWYPEKLNHEIRVSFHYFLPYYRHLGRGRSV